MQKLSWLFGTVLAVLCVYTSAAQTTSTIRGVVVDAASGQSLPYATVTVEGSPTGVVTDEHGEFTLPPLSVGRHTVVASLLGYEPAVVREVMTSSAKETVLEISMTESVQTLAQIVVRPGIDKDQPLNPMALAGARMLSVEEAGRFAGAVDDPARLVTAFAGAAGSVSGNNIAIRGNSPQSLQWKLEGVEIPNPNHFPEVTSIGGGVLTSFSSQVLANSDFFTGAFPAQYNNALSGVFDMALRNGNNQTHEHSAQVGSLGLEFASEGPFKKGGGSYLFNYRYSLLAPVANLIGGDLAEIAGVKYQDLSFKINVPTRRAGTFSLWGIASYDALRDPTKTREEMEAEEYFYFRGDSRQWMGAAGLSNRVFFSTNTYMKATLAATYAKNTLLGDSFVDGEPGSGMVRVMDMRDTNTNLIFNTYINTKTSARHTNRTGVTVTGLLYDDNYNTTPGQVYPTGPIANFVDTDGGSVMASLFTQSVFQLSRRFQTEVGVNGQYFAWNKKWTIEPRVSLRWQAAPKHAIAVAAGLHSRRERLDYYFVSNAATGGEMVNKNLDVAKAAHLTMSWDWSITRDLHLRVEPYFQHLYDVPVFPGTARSIINQTDFWMAEALVNGGKGRNYGVDITLERYLKNGLYWMVTGSIFDSHYTGDDDVWRNTIYNRRYLANVLGGKEWMLGAGRRHILGVSLRFNFMGGAWYTPIDEQASLAIKDPVEDERHMMERRWPAIFTAHATVGWQINRQHVTHEIGVKMLNLNGSKDYYGFQYNRLHNRMDEVTGTWMIPNIFYKISF
jgi:hypothetical protein